MKYGICHTVSDLEISSLKTSFETLSKSVFLLFLCTWSHQCFETNVAHVDNKDIGQRSYIVPKIDAVGGAL